MHANDIKEEPMVVGNVNADKRLFERLISKTTLDLSCAHKYQSNLCLTIETPYLPNTLEIFIKINFK